MLRRRRGCGQRQRWRWRLCADPRMQPERGEANECEKMATMLGTAEEVEEEGEC